MVKPGIDSQVPFSFETLGRKLPARASRAQIWYRCLYRLVTAFYFSRITVIGRQPEFLAGPVLFLGLHRNGAVDGFVYDQALGGPMFLISTQLVRSWWARLFFQGIAVRRAKDEGDRETNDDALRECLDCLRAGGSLFVFPEGTSSLGPRHLRFRNGAAWLLLEYLESGGPPLQVVPVGIHYECPWAFRAKVEVVIGSLIDTDLPAEASQRERLRLVKSRVGAALEEVGINVGSPEYQESIQKLAYGATLGTPHSYFAALKALEKSIPDPVRAESEALEVAMRDRPLLYHQGVPLFPMGPIVLYALWLMILGPVALAAITLNLPAYLAGSLAGRTLADDRNVISLWKILVGTPIFAFWALLVAVLTALNGKMLWLGAYALITWLGLLSYYRAKKLAVAVHNGVRCPDLRIRMLACRKALLRALSGRAESKP